MHEKEKIFGLDLARCIAICCVLLAHTLFLFPISAKSQFFGLAYFGFIGVEIFFVLSGYLVGTILINLFKNNPVDRKTTFYFWIRRWFRTLPNYYLVLLLASGLYYFSTKFFPFSDPQYFLYFIFSQNLLTPHPDFFSIAWSLSVEEWFYLVMPLWMIFCYQLLKGSNKFLLTAIISFILIILSIRIAINFLDPPEWEFGLLRVVIYRMDAIMIGVLAAYFHLHKPVLWVKFKRPVMVLGVLLFIFISVVFYYNIMGEQKGSMFFFYTFFFNVVSISIALMFPYLSGLKVKSPGFFQRVIIHTSRISYSLYLIHLLVASVVITIINKIVPEWYLLKFVAIILSCFVCATILYSIYELPMMNLRDKYKLPGKKT